MKEYSPLQFKLQELAKGNSLDSLEPFSDPKSWQQLHDHEKELLAQLLITRGRKLLDEGNSQAFTFFDKASQVASHSPKIFCLLGKAYASQDFNLASLRSATECYDRAISLAPEAVDVDIWKSYITLLLQKGELLNEVGYYSAAKEKCEMLCSCPENFSESSLSEFLWLWGRSYFLSGKIYGEAIEFYQSLEKYKLAASKGVKAPSFWKHYGDAHFELALLLDRPELYSESASFYQKSLQQVHDCFDSWYAMALCYYHLFEHSGSTLDYDFAKTSFENAAKLDSSNYKIWLSWGCLDCEYGKQHGDIKSLQESVIKFERADVIESNHPLIFLNWAEGLMFQGALSEDVQMLKAAERQIILSLEMQPDNSDAWHTYGSCLNELGRYFGDDRYYHQAIEKFQQGLSKNSQSPNLWQGLGLSLYILGEMHGDPQLVEKSCHSFSKALELGAGRSPQCWNDYGVSLMRLAELLNDKSYIERAVEKFESAMELQDYPSYEQSDPELLYNYGCAMDYLGDYYEDVNYYEKAVEALSKVLQIDPEHLHARYNLATAISHIGELAMDVECLLRAAEQFQILITSDPEDEMGWLEYGMTLLHLADLISDPAIPNKSRVYYEQAEIKLMHALGLGCLQACYALACLYSITENIGAGIFYLEKAEISNVLPPIEEIMHDEWLENLRETSAFQIFRERRERIEE